MVKRVIDKKYIERLLGGIVFVIAISLFVNIMQLLIANDGSDETIRIKGFYLEKKDTLDIVVMGASELMNDYCAPEVYGNYGLTSYPYAFAANPVPLWKYELEEIERTQHPQMLLIEINGALYEEDKYICSKERINFLGENIPLSANRIKLAYKESDNMVEVLFPIIKYHYRWKDITDESVRDRIMIHNDGYARLRGAMTPLYQTEYDSNGIYIADDEIEELNKNGEKALREFLGKCKNSEIPHIVFVEFPHILSSEKAYKRHCRVNKAAEIIQEEGFDFIDLTKDANDIGLDYEQDFFDTHHMVARGQRKLSNYIGKIASERYKIRPKDQSDENRIKWEDSVDMIHRFYKYFDKYTEEHSDSPHREVDWDLKDDYKTIKELEMVAP